MTDEPMAPVLRSWMRDTDRTAPDARHSADQVMARVEQTQQLGRWWWLPSFGRTRASIPTTDQTTQFQPAPIRATNDQTPTASVRTRSMFSPAKAIIAGVIVFAIGGAFLIAQPFDQQGSSGPGAATDTAIDPKDPRVATVTGHLKSGYGEGCEDCGARLEMDDARLSGDVTFTISIDWWESSTDPAGEGPSLWWGSMRIENDGGTWEGTHLHPHHHALRADENAPVIMQLVGSGDYEGLSAILYWYQDIPDSGDPALKSGEWMTGMVFPGDLPPDREDLPDA